MFRECRHIKSDGKKCHSPAQRGSAYCYFHARSRRRQQRIEQFRKFREGIQEIQQPERPALLSTGNSESLTSSN